MCLTTKNKVGRDMHQPRSTLCTKRCQQSRRFGIGGLCLTGLVFSGIYRSVSGRIDNDMRICLVDGARKGSVVGHITLRTAEALHGDRVGGVVQTGAAKLPGGAKHQRPLNAHRCASSQST